MAGTGSLEKRGDNTWRLVVSCGMKGDKQIKKKKTVTVKVACEQKTCRNCTRTTRCQSRREAEKLLTEFVIEIEKGMYIDPTKLTFADFVERWLKDYDEVSLAPKTLFRYKQILNSRILPAMGHLKVEQLSLLTCWSFTPTYRRMVSGKTASKEGYRITRYCITIEYYPVSFRTPYNGRSYPRTRPVGLNRQRPQGNQPLATMNNR